MLLRHLVLSIKGQKCGTFGDFSVFSFNTNKTLTTFGGGALVCNTKIEKERAVSLATQAKIKAFHYEHEEMGFN
jgi:dTDP-4-amino-4,6-dideoxygalactose transaminase